MINQQHYTTPNLTIEQLVATASDADSCGTNEDRPHDDTSRKRSSKGKQLWEPQQLVNKIRSIVLQKPDPINKEFLRMQLADDCGYNLSVIDREWKIQEQMLADEEAKAAKPQVEFSKETIALAGELSKSKNLFTVFPSAIDSLDYITDKWRAQALLMLIGMTLLEKERFICFYGDTSDGKTIASQILINFLDADRALGKVVDILDCSPEWMKYAGGKDGKALKNKLLFFDEMNPVKKGQDDRRQELIRQLDNEMSDVATFTIIDRIDGNQLGERRLKLEKPLYILITSITPPHKWDAQNQSRFIYVEFNLTPEQVYQAELRISNPSLSHEARQKLYQPFNCFLSQMLKRQSRKDENALYDVEVPFLKQLVKPVKDATGTDIRRFKLLKAAIQSSAVLHQHHRQLQKRSDGRDVLIAEWEDYINIKDVFEKVVPRMVQPSGTKHLETFKKIAHWLLQNPCSHRYEIAKHCRISKRAREEHLNDLVELGLLDITEPDDAKDRKTYYNIGERFMKLLQDVQSGQALDPTPGQIDEAIIRILHQIESVNSLSSSESPTDTMRESQGSPSEPTTKVPHSLGGERVEETCNSADGPPPDSGLRRSAKEKLK